MLTVASNDRQASKASPRKGFRRVSVASSAPIRSRRSDRLLRIMGARVELLEALLRERFR